MLADQIGRQRFERIARRHRHTGFGRHKAHYLELDRNLGRALEWAHWLGLDTGAKLSILDIGTGPGFFAYVCQHFGHRVVGTEHESDESRMWGWWKTPRALRRLLAFLPRRFIASVLQGRSLYADLTRLLGIEVQRWTVQRGVPAPSLGRFDLITAQALYFDCPPVGRGPRWGLQDWRWFVRDMERLIAPDGRLALEWTRTATGIDEIIAALKAAGSRAEGRRFVLDPPARARFVHGPGSPELSAGH